MQSWQELGFNEYNSSEFKELRDYLNNSIAAHFRKTLPVKGLQLLELMKKDVQAYFRSLCVNNVEASPYFDVPILASIDPAAFVNEVLALDPSAQASAFATFHGRYDRGQLNSALQSEKVWLTNVKAELEKRMESLRPMSTNRLKNRIGHYLDPFVADERPVSPAGADDNRYRLKPPAGKPTKSSISLHRQGTRLSSKIGGNSSTVGLSSRRDICRLPIDRQLKPLVRNAQPYSKRIASSGSSQPCWPKSNTGPSPQRGRFAIRSSRAFGTTYELGSIRSAHGHRNRRDIRGGGRNLFGDKVSSDRIA
jgi:hypothetical protein